MEEEYKNWYDRPLDGVLAAIMTAAIFMSMIIVGAFIQQP